MRRAGDRGWGRVLGLALVCIALAAVQPALLVFVPLGLLALALPPRRPVAVLAGVLLLVAALGTTRPEGFAAVERAWALLVGGWFVLGVALLPGQSFLAHGLAAVGAGAASFLGLLWARDGGLREVDAAFTERLRAGARALADSWLGQGGGRFAGELDGAIQRAIEIQVALYPALLALATLAGLAVAWWAWGRLSHRVDGGLAPLRDFRFSDALIWVLILGVVLVLPTRGWDLTRAGSNLLVFMGALYALRGLGVLLFLGGMPGPVGLLLAVLVAVVLYPIVMAATFVVGLFDTWLDIRTRRRASPGTEA